MEFADLIKLIVPAIVIIIIAFQVKLFIDNRMRMLGYGRIFKREGDLDWRVSKSTDTGFVDGIYVKTESVIFSSIVQSINKYLGNNTVSVIEFSLLKDAVDMHCQAVEDEIQTQMPVPLYCGLAGTMLGVIIGLGSLLFTDSISFLMGATAVSGVENATYGAAQGINDLLWGVAWAMVASICGITLTTVNSMQFKKCKLEEEEGKNNFLAWMQSRLLPELPSDTSQAMNNLVNNLNRFNSTFASNNEDLGKTLAEINDSYRTSAQILETVRQMDVQKMARANVRVLNELQQCMPFLEGFREYLESVKGYTDKIQQFTELFNSESERLHVLEEIRDFFKRHKGEIAKELTDADNTLRDAMKQLRETSAANVADLEKSLTEQAVNFKTLNQDICNSFKEQLKRMPNLMARLNELSEIPAQLLAMTNKIEAANERMAKEIRKSNENLVDGIAKNIGNIRVSSVGTVAIQMPKWMKIAAVIAVSLLTVSSVATTILLSTNHNDVSPVMQNEPATSIDSVRVDTLAIDTVL